MSQETETGLRRAPGLEEQSSHIAFRDWSSVEPLAPGHGVAAVAFVTSYTWMYV